MLTPHIDKDCLASIDKQTVVEQTASSETCEVDKRVIVDHCTHARHAVDSDRVDAKRARPQDPEDAKVDVAGEGEDKKALRFQARPFLLSPDGSSSETHQSNMFQDLLSNKQCSK